MEKKEDTIKEDVLDKDKQDQEKEEKEELKVDEKDKDLESQLIEKDEKIEELTDQLLRLQADFINYKNRVKKDKEKTYTYAIEDLINQLLPILDNFERALDSVEEDKKEDSFYQGVKMIYEQFLRVLEENGVSEIECEGKVFDPNLHHAVFVEEVEDEEEGIVLDVLQKGYTLDGKVIRPSMVKVSK
ncbi:molecular chaperone GrpE [Keratinibaculum paraultunense]|uniref:Protein GrpE n=1 Tax=Keratinibaculum paraultunense TaxID=1278232 RepID=A0A4R3KYD6_9FIRM|nr:MULTISPECIES: nucleotide exchange factor GrpE [Bacillota]MBU5455490.1 nucleotide exchange factor GrpE [Caproiciproducens sp. MSJ-32]QQY80460.1 nucleotide exchange factor GrpE [Keratinibaculum paraultunense]TCS91178.1 molecular chaperone GrpE [Keratinibaculum paraultunense]